MNTTPNLKSCFGYIRVSTTKQGTQGVSLIEQRGAILRFAGQKGLDIIEWFEEQETAAKRGRPRFNQMLRRLRRGEATGVVIHKIDRGARNLRDWLELGELTEAGVSVHFANESLDLGSRGGRLSADIQAVVAADFIRNLREETRKGFYGRLKQGFYPLPAPVGYLNRGKAKAKEIDPVNGPFVFKTFELYATGRFGLDSLREKVFEMGLRNQNGGKISRNGVSRLLRNPFYIGLMRLKSTGEIFAGNHEPLVTKRLFDRVQAILDGKLSLRTTKHDFLFRRLLSCQTCGYALIGERQKGYVYYRCHTPACPTTSVREENVDSMMTACLKELEFTAEQRSYFKQKVAAMKETAMDRRGDEQISMQLKLSKVAERLQRLTDAFLDGTIDHAVFEERKGSLLVERKQLEDASATVQTNSMSDILAKILERADSAWLSYEVGILDEKREILESLTSNRLVLGKNGFVELSQPFLGMVKCRKDDGCDPPGAVPRTCEAIIGLVADWIEKNPESRLATLAKPNVLVRSPAQNPFRKDWDDPATRTE